MRQRISKAQLDDLGRRAVAHTDVSPSFGTYAAILTFAEGSEKLVTTERLNPDSDVLVIDVSHDEADTLIRRAHRR